MFQFDRIAQNLVDIGAVSLEDFLDGHSTAPHSAPVQGTAVARLQQTCQRALRSTDALKFEFVGTTNKQCILTITKPDGVRRAYATQPVFARKNDAKLAAAKIAIDMGALDFLLGARPVPDLAPPSVETSSAAPSAAASETAPETSADTIEKCCFRRAGGVSPHWVPFSDPRSPHKQGCALRVQISPHVSRIYLSDSTFDTHSDAREACARAAVSEGVIDYIKRGNDESRPSSPAPSTSHSPPANDMTPWTLQIFYDSLPRPFPESFDTNDASEINALAWMNNILQNARGGKLVLSFFFTSDGPPGLHGCILKLDRPGEYKASLVDARFPKRSDAKAAVCLQAMSEGIGDYIRSITSAMDNKVTPTMRSFSSGLVYPALTSALSKIDSDFRPHFEYNKDRDAFGATLLASLSTLTTSDQERRYTVPSDYRSKADAKVAVICHAAEQGVVEFVRFRGGPVPDGYVSPYSLHVYDPEASKKRKQPGSVEDAEQSQPVKKKRKKKGKQRVDSHHGGSCLAPVGQYLPIHPSGDQIHGISGPGDMGLSRNHPVGGLCDPSQPGVGDGGGSGAARPVPYGQGSSYNAHTYASSYPAVLDPRFVGNSRSSGHGYGIQPGAYGSGSSGPSHAGLGTSTPMLSRSVKDAELEPGEVVSSAESEFSVGSSRNDENEPPAKEPEIGGPEISKEGEGDVTGDVAARSKDKGKAKETSPANTSTTVERENPITITAPHVKNLIDYCARHGCGTPSFHEVQSQGRFLVWIVIGRDRYDLPTTYASGEEGRQRVAKQVLARLSKGSSQSS